MKVLHITMLKEMVTVDKGIISQTFISLKFSNSFKYYNKREYSIGRDSWQRSLPKKESQKF